MAACGATEAVRGRRVRTRFARTALAGLALTALAAAPAADARIPGWKHKKATVAPYKAWTNTVAWCESRGQWHINTGSGYYGGVQFSLTSWRAVGGAGYPHNATRLEQRYRAVRLLRIQGYGAWPHCGGGR